MGKDFLLKYEKVGLLYLIVATFSVALFAYLFLRKPYELYTYSEGKYKNLSAFVSPSNLRDYPYELKLRFDIEGKRCFTLFFKSFDRLEHPLGSLDFPGKVIITDIYCKYGIPYVSFYDGKVWATERKLLSSVRDKIKPNEFGCFKRPKIVCYKREVLVADLLTGERTFPLFTANHFPIDRLEVSFPKRREVLKEVASYQRVYLDLESKEVKLSPPFKFPSLKSFILFSSPVFLLTTFYLWFRYGREKPFPSVEYYHDIPNPKREAWQVYYLLEVSNLKFPAILLHQLLQKGTLKIERTPAGFKLKLSSGGRPTETESYALEEVKKLLKELTKEGYAVETEGGYLLKLKPERKLADILSRFLRNLENPPTLERFAREVFNLRGYRAVEFVLLSSFLMGALFFFLTFWAFGVIFLLGGFVIWALSYFFGILAPPAVAFGLWLLSAFFYDPHFQNANPYLFFGALYSLIAFSMAVLWVSLPRQFFLSYKKDLYKEALLWLGFKKLLKDFGKLEESPPPAGFKKVIPYAVAFGLYEDEAHSLVKAFRELIDRVSSSRSSSTVSGGSSGSASSGGGGGGR